MSLEAKIKAAERRAAKGKGLRILATKKMVQRLPTALAKDYH